MIRRGGLAVLGALAFGVLAGAAGAPRQAPSAPAVAAAPKPAAFIVAVLGDESAEALAEGLRQTLGAEPGFAVVADIHAAGLSDPTRFDWEGAARTLLASRHVDAAAIMVGTGDRKALPDGTGLAEPGSPRWRTLYGDRIAALVGLFQAQATPVLWVGLPIVADDQAAAGIVARNEIARDRAGAAGASYLDSWDAFADEGGRFDASGPDRDGRIVRLRGADGRGFTRAGALKLASFVEPALRRARTTALAAAAQTVDVVLPPGPEVELDVNNEIRRELGLPTLDPLPATPPGAAPAAAILLTAPPLSPDGRLLAASVGPAPLAGTAASLAQRALVEGRPIPPKIGRIDDFSWPRP